MKDVFQSLLHQGISLLRTGMAPWRPGAASVSIPSSSGHQFTDHGGTQAAPAARRVSIPSSSGHQFTVIGWPLSWLVSPMVSIPSSSGHQFTGGGMDVAQAATLAGFQSLLHQGISLLPVLRHWADIWHSLWFQSLLHQGISLLAFNLAPILNLEADVSIPSSSGHQFTGDCCAIRIPQGRRVSIPSSSGHQFTEIHSANARQTAEKGFNPFFIRASVY